MLIKTEVESSRKIQVQLLGTDNYFSFLNFDLVKTMQSTRLGFIAALRNKSCIRIYTRRTLNWRCNFWKKISTTAGLGNKELKFWQLWLQLGGESSANANISRAYLSWYLLLLLFCPVFPDCNIFPVTSKHVKLCFNSAVFLECSAEPSKEGLDEGLMSWLCRKRGWNPVSLRATMS